MNDDVRKTIYGTLTVFVVGLAVWIGFIFINACGLSLSCNRGLPKVYRTPIPTLIPAAMPAATQFAGGTGGAVATPTFAFAINPNAPRPANPGGPGEAIFLTGDPAKGAEIFAANCAACHGAEGKAGVPNPGSKEGVVPTLNPITPLLKDADKQAFAYNLDLFLQNGSNPPGAALQMPAWGALESLSQQQIADVIAYIIELNP